MAKAKKVLKLAKKFCQLGSHINVRTEKHGDEDVPACDFTLENIMLERGELNTLLGDDDAHDALYRKQGKGLLEPAFPTQFKPFALADRFDEAQLELRLTLASDPIVNAVKLAKLKIAPQTGGLTALTLQVQAANIGTEDLADLIGYVSSAVYVDLTFGKRAEGKSKDQPELPMGSHTQNGDDTPADPEVHEPIAPAAH